VASAAGFFFWNPLAMRLFAPASRPTYYATIESQGTIQVAVSFIILIKTNAMATDKERNNEKNSAKVDKEGDFLGHEHGNAMPEKETASDKILNPEENGFSRNKPNRNNTDDETPSIH